MNPQRFPDRVLGRRAASNVTLVPHVTMLPLGEQFLLWTLRQWQCEVALWDAEKKLPTGGSILWRGVELAGLGHGLPHFAMVMDALLCGAGRPYAIHPLTAPIVSPDEGTLLALFGLAQHGLDGPLAACFSAILPPSAGLATVNELRLLAGLLEKAGLGSAPSGSGGWIQ